MFSVARLFARWALSGGSDGAFRRPGVGDRAPRGLALASLPRLTRVDGTRGNGRGGSRQRQSAVPASAPLLPAVYALLLALYSLPAGAAPVGIDQQTTDGTSNVSRFSIETTTSVGARANAYFSSLTNVGIGSTSPGAYLDVQMPASPTLSPFRILTSAAATIFEVNNAGTILSGTWNGTAVGATFGGTGQTVYVVGDILYANTTTTLARLPATTSGYVLTSNGAGVAPSWTGAGTLWTDGGTVTYRTDIADDVAVGAANTLVAPFSVDVSADTVRIGDGSGTSATLNMFASDADTGSITYTTDDAWTFTGGNVAMGPTTVAPASTNSVLTVGDTGPAISTFTGNGLPKQVVITGGTNVRNIRLLIHGYDDDIALPSFPVYIVDENNNVDVVMTGGTFDGTNNLDPQFQFRTCNVSIGTSAGAARLEIAGPGTTDTTASATKNLHIANPDGTTYAIMINNTTRGTTDVRGFGFWQSDAGYGIVDNDDDNVMTFDLDGDVGIGIGEAASSARLHVRSAGGGSDDLLLGNAGAAGIDILTPAGQSLRIGANNAEYMVIMGSSNVGNVGLGTTAPGTDVKLHVFRNDATPAVVRIQNNDGVGDRIARLEILSDIGATTGKGFWVLHDGDTTTQGWSSDGVLYIRGVDDGTAQPMGIAIRRSTGAVGIGTTTPATRLDAGGNVAAVGDTFNWPRKTATGAPTGTAVEGMSYYNEADNKFYGYNGTSWVDLGATGAGGLTDGTVTNSTLRWDGAAWAENTQLLATNTAGDPALYAATGELNLRSGTGALDLNDGVVQNVRIFTDAGAGSKVSLQIVDYAAASNNYLGISHNGTDALIENSNATGDIILMPGSTSGNVGIGTTGPGNVLDVWIPAEADDGIRITNFASVANSNEDSVRLALWNQHSTSNSTYYLQNVADQVAARNGDFEIYRTGGGGARFVIDGASPYNVGIGSSSPGTTLTVSGGDLGFDYQAVSGQGVRANRYIRFFDDASYIRCDTTSAGTVQQMEFSTWGNGTGGAYIWKSYPGDGAQATIMSLTRDGDIRPRNVAYVWPTAIGGAGTQLTTDASGNLTWGAAGGGSGSLWTDGGSATYLTATGDNVGIGTNGASGKLTVYNASTDSIVRIQSDSTGAASFQGLELSSSGTDDAYVWNYGNGVGGKRLVLGVFGTGTVEVQDKLNVTGGDLTVSAGNVGIGTTTMNGHLVVYNATVPFLRVQNNDENLSTDGLEISLNVDTVYAWNYEPGAFVFGTSNVERMQIAAGGNVGIGSNNPQAKLDINGTNLKINGVTYVWPSGGQAAGEQLQTDGSGNLTWEAAGSGGAGSSEPFVTIGNTAGLSTERALTGTANQITVTDGGANTTVTLSTPQNIHTAATPQFARMGLGAAADGTIPLRVFGTGTVSNIALGDIAAGEGEGSMDFNVTDFNDPDTGGVDSAAGHISMNMYFNGSAWTHRDTTHDGWIWVQRVQDDDLGYMQIAHVAKTTGTQTEVFRIAAGGNVGLGSSNPQAKLDINGTNLKINGVAYVWPSGGQAAGEQLQTDGAGNLTWEAAGGGSGPWTDGSGITYLTDTAEDMAVGGSTLASPFSVDVSANTARIGSGATANAILNMYASDGATGSITYTTNDGWDFSGGNIGLGVAAPTSTGARLAVDAVSRSSGAITMTASADAVTFTTSASITINTGDFVVPTTSTAQARPIFIGGTGTSFTVGQAFGAAVSAETFTIYSPSATFSNGNVGIGLTAPTERLDVAGGPIRARYGLTVYTDSNSGAYRADDLLSILNFDNEGGAPQTLIRVADENNNLDYFKLTRLNDADPANSELLLGGGKIANFRMGDTRANEQEGSFSINVTDFNDPDTGGVDVSAVHMSLNASYNGTSWDNGDTTHDGWIWMMRSQDDNVGYCELYHVEKTSGTQNRRMKIESTGEVGLNADPPANTRLYVSMPSEAWYGIEIKNATYGGASFGFWQGNNGTGGIDVNGGNSIFINAEQDVGIKGEPGAGGYDLEVNGVAWLSTGTAWVTGSDRRIKTDIHDLDDPVGVIKRLHPVRFRFNDEYRAKHASVKDIYHYSFIAQEFQEVFPDSVLKGGNGFLSIDTSNVTPYLVAAFQEEDRKVAALQKAVATQAADLAALSAKAAKAELLEGRVAELEKLVRTLTAGGEVKPDGAAGGGK